ncbi:unnamed protein product [Colias eurytheme]|nr:unnamed protein product [Colias eurytheme]
MLHNIRLYLNSNESKLQLARGPSSVACIGRSLRPAVDNQRLVPNDDDDDVKSNAIKVALPYGRIIAEKC